MTAFFSRVSRVAARAALVFMCVAGVGAGAVRAATVAVPAGGDLAGALLRAQPGDTLVLAPGATYVGNFTLPVTGGAADITVTTDPAGLPGPGARIAPGAPLAILRSPNSAPAVQTAPGAHNWRLVLLEITSAVPGGDLVTLGDGSSAQATLAAVPHDLVVDRCYLHGDPVRGQKRGLALNSARTTVTGSYIATIMAVGQDSQAIAGWNGPGPFTLTNNYLEAAGENVLFGGSDPAIPGLVPSDITVAGNTLAKPPAWRTAAWQVKNLFELKNAQRVTITGNTFEYIWQAAQSGYAILFTPRNQDGRCPWCVVTDVTFTGNLLRHLAAGINILGTDDAFPSQQARRIVIRNNLVVDLDARAWGGTGYFLLLTGGPREITVDHNTVIQDHAAGILMADGPPILGFTCTNNLFRHSAYGIIGTDHAPGTDTISAYFPAALVTSNLIAGAGGAPYPSGNLLPGTAMFAAQFVSYEGGDYRLAADSPLRGAGLDGRDIGASLGSAPTVSPTPTPPPTPTPSPTAMLRADVSGTRVQLDWSAAASQLPSGAVFVVEAGSAEGRTDVAEWRTAASALRVDGVAPGTYFVRVHAYAAGREWVSNEVTVTVR